jgi:hypothetical protein
MQEKGRKQSKKHKDPSTSARSNSKNFRSSNKPPKTAEKRKRQIEQERILAGEEIEFLGPISGNPSFLQSTNGKMGNFELVVPLASGGLAYYWRDNDDKRLLWHGPVKFGIESGQFDGVSLIQGDFGEMGNLELAATDLGGHHLMHFWRDSGPDKFWNGPSMINKESLVPLFYGGPSMIWSNSGCRGNFDLVVPLAEGGFSYYWRNNDDPSLPWCGPLNFAENAGIFEAVTLIQSNFGSPGNLEIVARSGDRLEFFWGEYGQEIIWHGPETIATGVTGTPSLIQGSFGNKGNFEMVVPLDSGGLAYYWRDNDDAQLQWYGPLTFGMSIGKVDGVSLIQGNFGNPGHLELVAQAGGHLVFFWRDSGPDFRWNGPYYLTMQT